MEQRRLKKEYKEYVFIKAELEECLTFALERESDSLPDYLKPYKTRVGILLTEAANILAGFRPKDLKNRGADADTVLGYKDSLWDAVDNNVLSGTNEQIEYDFNHEYRTDITLVKDEVTLWAKKHDFNWPFDLQKKVEIDESIPVEDTNQIIQTLRAENETLKKELSDAISKMPIFLGEYRDDDPLLLAIELRNTEWSRYNEDNRRSIPSQEGLVSQIKEQYKSVGMTDVQAKAIEKVACPIRRK